jgi:biotin carboxylase
LTLRDETSPALLCLASFEKGQRFLEQANDLGCRVYLLTSESLRDSANWPQESLADIFYMPDVNNEWNLQHMLLGVAHLCRNIHIDRVVALDDFDLEKAALLREHFRIPGMGESATRLFRDKLAMRMMAQAAGIPVPEFTATINYGDITRFVDSVPPPWVLKPRLMAGAIGIRKYGDRQELWNRIHSLEDEQSFFVLERFVPGDIFHVDSIWSDGDMIAAIPSAYGTPPLTVMQSGGIFTTRLLPRASEPAVSLSRLNEKVLRTFGMSNGVSHTEFIRSHENGEFFFLETSARVGGAHIPELIEAGTGINMWAEWAKIEFAGVSGTKYTLPQLRNESAGLLVSLARQEWPDTSGFTEPELVWRLRKRHHVGMVIRSPDHSRINALLEVYEERVRREHHASLPPREKVGE